MALLTLGVLYPQTSPEGSLFVSVYTSCVYMKKNTRVEKYLIKQHANIPHQKPGPCLYLYLFSAFSAGFLVEILIYPVRFFGRRSGNYVKWVGKLFV